MHSARPFRGQAAREPWRRVSSVGFGTASASARDCVGVTAKQANWENNSKGDIKTDSKITVVTRWWWWE